MKGERKTKKRIDPDLTDLTTLDILEKLLSKVTENVDDERVYVILMVSQPNSNDNNPIIENLIAEASVRLCH